MVEKQIEFYFSKHPHIELDCGWSRKGSSNTERSLFMAKNNHRNRNASALMTLEGYRRNSRREHNRVVIYLTTLTETFEVHQTVLDAQARGVDEVELRVMFVDERRKDFDIEYLRQCPQLVHVHHAIHFISHHGYQPVKDKIVGFLAGGRVAETFLFTKDGYYDVYPESSRTD